MSENERQLRRLHDLGRNDPCHCGSGKKYKKCCLAKDQATEAEQRALVAEQAAQDNHADDADADADDKKSDQAANTQRAQPRATDQPWKRGAQRAQSFQRHNIPQKRGNS